MRHIKYVRKGDITICQSKASALCAGAAVQGTIHNQNVFYWFMNVVITAIRGRKYTGRYVQELEIGGNITHSLTTFAKDNMIYKLYEL